MKKDDAEIEALIALALQPAPEKEPELNDHEKFVLDVNLSSGLDEMPFRLLWDYYRRWTTTRPNEVAFAAFLTSRFEKVQRQNHTYYLIDESRLRVSREDMKRKIGERLNEQRKIRKKEAK